MILFAELCTAYVQVRAHMYVERFDVLLYMGKETLEKMQRLLVKSLGKTDVFHVNILPPQEKHASSANVHRIGHLGGWRRNVGDCYL